MAYTPIAPGSADWDVPVNAAFTSQDARITANEGNITSNSANIATLLARLPILARKTADQAVTNTTTYADAADLVVAVTAGNTYKVEGFFVYTTLTAAGINLKLTGPTGTGTWNFATLSGGGSTDTGTVRYSMSSNGVGTSRTGGTASVGAGNELTGYVRGIFQPTANGSLQFAFTQNSANATATTLKANSWLELTRMN